VRIGHVPVRANPERKRASRKVSQPVEDWEERTVERAFAV
jgi:hypothetical protein